MSEKDKLIELEDEELKQVTGGASPWSETLESSELLVNGGQHQR